MTERPSPHPPAGGAACALLINADADLAGLIEQWLHDEGLQLLTARHPAPGAKGPLVLQRQLALVIVDLPFPSRDHVDALRDDLGPQGGAPILLLSTNVFANVDCCGPAARALGADGLLPKPTSGEALRRAVRGLMRDR